ncbi:secreted RxLR effector protein 161-like [Macadamia integrifolia]|uniref:secreted RxLR effector protein 161-like n=1 Tax=Macadamia integrifolia TaxID=60698 RepID=UPI001C4E7444|nr:secreted RxLR effector protein 161-like [Macadamia integrifolia]
MTEDNSQSVVVVYVDDLIFGGHCDKLYQQFVEKMRTKVEMSMLGELSYFLGFPVSEQEDDIFVSQIKYVKEMLKKFGMEDSKPMGTPMAVGCKLSSNGESPIVDQTLYRSMIGRFLYLTSSRIDILQLVCLVARFQASPKEAHLLAVKRILRYLKGTLEYGLWYPKTNNFIVTAFSDADWAGSIDDRKITSGGAFFLGKSSVAWHRKKHESVSLSIAEAEYIVATTSCTQVIWMKRQISDFSIHSDEPV